MKIPTFITTLATICLAGSSHAFVLVAYDMETMATNPDPAINRSATASTVHSSVTVGTFDSYHNDSSNPDDFGVNNTYNSSQVNVFSHRSLSNTPYWQFTVTPGVGETIQLASLTFDAHAIMTLAGGTAVVDYVIRWSGDSFASTLATVAGPTADVNNQNVFAPGLSADLSAIPDQTSPFTIRIEVVNRGGTNGTYSQRGGGIDNLTLNAVPEPAAALLGSFGFLFLLRRRR